MGGRLAECRLELLPSLKSTAMAHQKSETNLGHAEMVPDFLRAAIDALNFGFAVFDKDLHLIACNRAFRELRGYPVRLCAYGASLAELYRFNAKRGDYGSGDPEALVESRLLRARSRIAQTLEYELSSGHILSIHYAPIERQALVLSYTDVTEQKRAEQALKVSEERYAFAMAGANEGMWDWLAHDDRIFISKRYKNLIRLSTSGNQISLGEWLSMIHPDDLAVRESARNEHLNGNTEFYDCEYRVRCGDGKYRWFRDRAKSYWNDKGEIIRMAGSLTDVTAGKKAEMDLLEANQRINHQNAMLTSLSRRLSKYLSPQIYSSIFSGKQTVEISSRRKKLTIFFSDIVDFTETTEGLESEDLSNLLNHYLTEMSKIALEYGATIDKFVGDAIMAFFGDPESRGIKEDAIMCVRMAIAMQQRMNDLQRDWRDQGIERPFQIRIGINTGFCTVGNFGSEDRMDYTIIGNEANLASRLQSHARAGGIIIAHETFSLIKDTVVLEERDSIAAKGFSRPIQCYEVIGRLDQLKAEGRIIREYDEGVRIFLDLYRSDSPKLIRTLEHILDELKPQ